ncbi:hypothetical protein N7509_005481 [Penicillium cosmopolitanum]|uniref:Uncharacterized protein n=1 Tax=Penicillium cosmopolitanum TaxID=1131564 RepID=A0A9X0BA43_9EURO|nr:uncharacterized protein N7509_005481 [Penicillium cosmopolitanum]KAJ5397368.1 hypothetical protein N7509_005481 [Penicillium cosmopolitanum]
MAAVRLRKAFRYPEESDDDREELDEEEQDRVIQQLQQQNEARNAQYSLVFTAIPLVSTLTFLPSLFTAQSFGERLLSLLGILSLLATAYMMRLAPLHPDRKGKKPLSPENERLEKIHSALLPVNGAVGVLLTLIYLLFLRGGSSFIISPVLYLIPGVMLAVILLAKDTMLSVDLATLKDLQYEYKGA